jgi:hypothetical protein
MTTTLITIIRRPDTVKTWILLCLHSKAQKRDMGNPDYRETNP